MSKEIKTRGNNKSFYHYYVNEIEEDGETWGEPVFFKTMAEMKLRYNISRATIYRLLTDPDASTKFPHKITKQFIHYTALPFINNNQNELYE